MERAISTSIFVNNRNITFAQLHRMFAGSSYGERLVHQTRYDRFKPKNMSGEEWIDLLGADVNNLNHMPVTTGITRHFLSYCQNPPLEWTKDLTDEAKFNGRESEDLLLTATVHDWGEAVVGDKMFDLKTNRDEDEELMQLRLMTAGLFCQEENNELLSRIKSVVNTVLPDRNSKLGKAFNAIERIGYLRTALRALGVSSQVNGHISNNLQWLAQNVLLNQIPILLTYADIYPPVDAFMKMNSERIYYGFYCVDNDRIMNNYPPNEIESKKQSFKQARSQWTASSYFRVPLANPELSII